MASAKERQLNLGRYLDAFLQNRKAYPRTKCCGSSRSLYCTECQRLLVPKLECPASLRDGRLRLPFDLDILLCDRRKSATGLHAFVLLQASALKSEFGLESTLVDADDADKNGGFAGEQDERYIGTAPHQHPHFSENTSRLSKNLQSEDDVEVATDDREESQLNAYPSSSSSSSNSRLRRKVRLFDMDNDGSNHEHKNIQSLPSFSESELEKSVECHGHEPGTFLLFPSEDSVPLSEVASEITRLVVLDCKWTQSFTKQRLPEIANIRKVRKQYCSRRCRSRAIFETT